MDWYYWMITVVLLIVSIAGAISVFVHRLKYNDKSATEVYIINPNVNPNTITCVEHDWDFKPMEPDKFPFLG